MPEPHPGSSPALARVVGLPGAVLLGLGSILGTGVYVSLGIAAGVAADGILVAVILAALLATANGLSSAQLAAAHPVSGGTYEYAWRLVHPNAGFAAGWLFLTAKSASAATAALGCAAYLARVSGIDAGPGTRVGLALLITGVLTLLVTRGMRRSNQVNAVIVTCTLGVLTLFVVAGLRGIASGTAVGDGSGLGPLLASSLRTGLDRPGALMHATALLFVAYTGYGRIATLGEEVAAPARTIPRAIVTTLMVSMILYVAVATVAVGTVGAEAFAAATGLEAAPLEAVARALPTPWVGAVVAIGAITAMAGVLLNLLLGLSRVLLAMARRSDMPEALALVDADRASPTRAVRTMGVVVALLVLLGDVYLTWTLSAFTVLVYYGLTNLAALRLADADRRFPRWIAGAGLAGCFGLTVFIPLTIWAAGIGLLLIGFVGRAARRR